MQTTADYIDTYSEIEPLERDFDSKLEHFLTIYEEAKHQDEIRGLINIQHFYKNHSESLRNNAEMIELLRTGNELTKQEILATKDMAALPPRDQIQFWQRNFKPLLEQEDALREKVLTLQSKMAGRRN